MQSPKSLSQWITFKRLGAFSLVLLVLLGAKKFLGSVKNDPNRYRNADIFTPAEAFLKDATTSAALEIFNQPESCNKWATGLGDVVAKSASNAYSIAIISSQTDDLPPKFATSCPFDSTGENPSTHTLCMRLTPKTTLFDALTGRDLDIFAMVNLSFWDPIGHQSATCQHFEKLPIRPIQTSYTVYWRAKENSEHEFFSQTSAGTVLAQKKRP